MGRIKKLSPSVIRKIAAGEVVERPASVVKELVENSIDALSTEIVVNIQDGGRRLIEVIDNGCGMTEEDAILAVERHTTSKISGIEDIEAITTLGFRGEALYAISSVSMFSLVTRNEEEELATKVVIHGGMFKGITKVAREKGTTVSVENLFFNLRARRKFLRSKRTEELHVRRIITEFMLSHPEIAFSYSEDGYTVYNVNASSIIERISNVLEGDVLEEKETHGYARLKIYLVEAQNVISDVFVFVNKRAVTERALTYTIKSALKERYLSWKLPVVVLFIEIEPSEVDVNVHPTKREVRFRNKEELYAQVLSLFSTKKILSFDNSLSTQHRLPLDKASTYRFVGELWGVYLVYERDEELVLVDKHAFHERVLFDGMLRKKEKSHPVFVYVEGIRELRNWKDVFSSVGIEVDFEDEVVRSVPEWAAQNTDRIIKEIISQLKEGYPVEPSWEILARAACRAAVKAGDFTSRFDANYVIEVLCVKGFDLTCPHGRPVVVRLKKGDVESWFERRK